MVICVLDIENYSLVMFILETDIARFPEFVYMNFKPTQYLCFSHWLAFETIVIDKNLV